jgi:hypothetical protein
MNGIVKGVVITLATMVVVWTIVFVGILIGNSANKTSDTSALPYNKTEYLEKVKNNGGGELEECAYTYLIDTYGVGETMKIDIRIAIDENDVDSRVYVALKECL